MFEEGLVLKYELASEDLDTLVTVRSDQDIKHMLEEHDRHQTERRTMLRAFLFPPSLTVIETRTLIDPNAMQQRYIDAINGHTRTKLAVKVAAPASPNQPFNTMSSPCTSPKSPYSLSPEPSVPNETNPSNPNPNPNSVPYTCTVNNPICPNQISFIPPPQFYYPNPSYRQNISSYYLPEPPTEYPYMGVGVGVEKPVSGSPLMGRAEIGKRPLNQGLSHLYQIVSSRWYPRAGDACGYYVEGGMNGHGRGDPYNQPNE